MKILLGSHHFFPSTGGIETATNLLAREFVAQGNEVRVITQTEGNGDFPFPVVRRPGPLELLRQVRWCDAFLQNNISLRTFWPLLFVRRPFYIAHQTWMTNPDGSTGWQHRLKRFVLRYGTSLAISRAIAEQLPVPSIQVGNPYDDKVFRNSLSEPRTNELIFVGRLVSSAPAQTSASPSPRSPEQRTRKPQYVHDASSSSLQTARPTTYGSAWMDVPRVMAIQLAHHTPAPTLRKSA